MPGSGLARLWCGQAVVVPGRSCGRFGAAMSWWCQAVVVPGCGARL